jgi:L-arabinokinase
VSEPIAQGEVQLPADLAAFVERLQDDASPHGDFLEGHGTTYVARAPGRLDVMGGIADYSGATVCELPLAEAAIVALRWREDDRVRVRTVRGVDGPPTEVSMTLSDLVGRGAPRDYERIREWLGASSDDAWAAYVLGAFPVLARERGVRLQRGADLLVDSRVPPGKGVSSSAALEVSTLRALTEATDTTLDGYTLALLGQTVENHVVGAPCGLMDQLTSTLGCAGELLRIRCQGRSTPEPLPIPEGVRFLGVDSGVRHAVSGASYGDVRVGAFMGYRIVADLLGLEARPAGDGRVKVDDPVHGGWLCNISPSLFRARFLDRLPATLSGEEFLERYGGTTDPVTRVDPTRSYPVRAAAAHPVEEEHRVRAFLELLSGSPTSARLELAGELMLQAHASYGRCDLGSDATDELVELAREAGPVRGVYGAKITGGGSGGTVAFLAHGEGGEHTVREIAATFGSRHGFEPTVFAGSSPGAMRIPVLRVAL